MQPAKHTNMAREYFQIVLSIILENNLFNKASIRLASKIQYRHDSALKHQYVITFQ